MADITNKISVLPQGFDALSAACNSSQTAFSGLKKAAETFGVTLSSLSIAECTTALSAFNTKIYDLSRSTQFAAEGSKGLRTSIENISAATKLSIGESADFLKTLNSSTTGFRMTGEAAKNFAVILSNEFGGSIQQVTKATQDLMNLQEKHIGVMSLVQKQMNPDEIFQNAIAMKSLGGATNDQINSFVRLAQARKDGSKSWDEEQQKQQKFNNSLLELKKIGENLVIKMFEDGSMQKFLTDSVQLITTLTTKFAEFAKSPLFTTLFKGGLVLGAGAGVLTAVSSIAGPIKSVLGLLGGKAGAIGSGLGTLSSAGATPVKVVNFNEAGSAGGGEDLLHPSMRGAAGAAGGFFRKEGLFGRIAPIALATGAVSGIASYAGNSLKESGHDQIGSGLSALGNIGGKIATYASIGAMFGPWGLGIGAIAGAVHGLYESWGDVKHAITGSVEQTEEEKKKQEEVLATAKKIADEEHKYSDYIRTTTGMLDMRLKTLAFTTTAMQQLVSATEVFTAANSASANFAGKYAGNIQQAYSLNLENVDALKMQVEQQEKAFAIFSKLYNLSQGDRTKASSSITEQEANAAGISKKDLDAMANEVNGSQLRAALAKEKGEIARARVALYEAQSTYAKSNNPNIEYAQKEKELAQAREEQGKSMYASFGNQFQLQQQQVNKIKEEIEGYKEQRKIQQDIFNDQTRSDSARRKAKYDLLDINIKITKAETEQNQIAKNYRDAYLEAIGSFSNVEGSFAKIISSRDVAHGEAMRLGMAAQSVRGGWIGNGSNTPFATQNSNGTMTIRTPLNLEELNKQIDPNYVGGIGFNRAASISGQNINNINVPGINHGEGHASGGFVNGPGGRDVIPAMLTNGEFVVNASSSKKHRDLLIALNKNKFDGGGFAKGTGQIIENLEGIADPHRYETQSYETLDVYKNYIKTHGREKSNKELLAETNPEVKRIHEIAMAADKMVKAADKQEKTVTKQEEHYQKAVVTQKGLADAYMKANPLNGPSSYENAMAGVNSNRNRPGRLGDHINAPIDPNLPHPDLHPDHPANVAAKARRSRSHPFTMAGVQATAEGEHHPNRNSSGDFKNLIGKGKSGNWFPRHPETVEEFRDRLYGPSESGGGGMNFKESGLMKKGYIPSIPSTSPNYPGLQWGAQGPSGDQGFTGSKGISPSYNLSGSNKVSSGYGVHNTFNVKADTIDKVVDAVSTHLSDYFVPSGTSGHGLNA